MFERYALMLLFSVILLSADSAASSGQLYDLQGQPRSITEFVGQGQWTVVMFWASDCHVCNAEVHEYVLFHDAFHDKQAAVLGISLDGHARKAEALRFIDRHMVDFPNLIGEPGTVAKLYTRLVGEPWLGTPSFLVFSPAGELRARQVGAVPAELIEAFIERESSPEP